MFKNLSRFRKSIASEIVAVYVWVGVVLASASGPITKDEWYALAGTSLITLGVYAVANEPAPADPTEALATSDTAFNRDDVLPEHAPSEVETS